MDAVEFAEWQAYYRIQPFGDDWAQASTIAWMLYQVNRTRQSENLKIDTFLPRGFGSGITEAVAPQETPRDMYQRVLRQAQAAGIKVKHG